MINARLRPKMSRDERNTSLIIHAGSIARKEPKNCRQKLKFDNETSNSSRDRSVLSVLTLNDTRRAFRNGAERISRTFSQVRTSLGSFSQRFKIPTKRRQILEEGPMTPGCLTPQTMSRKVLGRTPTQLYSPFSIETPKENIRPR